MESISNVLTGGINLFLLYSSVLVSSTVTKYPEYNGLRALVILIAHDCMCQQFGLVPEGWFSCLSVLRSPGSLWLSGGFSWNGSSLLYVDVPSSRLV